MDKIHRILFDLTCEVAALEAIANAPSETTPGTGGNGEQGSNTPPPAGPKEDSPVEVMYNNVSIGTGAISAEGKITIELEDDDDTVYDDKAKFSITGYTVSAFEKVDAVEASGEGEEAVEAQPAKLIITVTKVETDAQQ